MTDFQQRAARTRSEIKDLGLSMAEVARRIDYGTEAGTAYVRQVLNAQATSNPILDLIEVVVAEERESLRRSESMDEIEAEERDETENGSGTVTAEPIP